jgi:hypothetical protein
LTPRGYFALTPYATVGLVTGVSRLHDTLATGQITAKETRPGALSPRFRRAGTG